MIQNISLSWRIIVGYTSADLKAVTDPTYLFSFFFSIKKKPLKVKPGSDEVPEDAIIMESYDTASSRERLPAWK